MILQATFKAKAITEHFGKDPDIEDTMFHVSESSDKKTLIFKIPNQCADSIELSFSDVLDLQECLKTFIDRMNSVKNNDSGYNMPDF